MDQPAARRPSAIDFTRIAAVLFDLDGTLYRQPPLRALMALELSTLPLVGPIKARSRLTALRAYREAQEALRRQNNAVDPLTQVTAAARASGLPIDEVATLVEDWMQTRPLKYLRMCRSKGLDLLLDEIDRRGLRAGVLSDYPPQAKLRALGLDGRFSPVLCATDPEIGAFKPSPRGFLRACQVWGLAPDRVLFVGDRADVDAAGAAAAGMPCVIVNGRLPVADSASCSAIPTLLHLSLLIKGK